jgi:hypothetical protein
LAKPNFQFQKRQKELAKKEKKELKKQKKMEQKADASEIPMDEDLPSAEPSETA